MKKIYYEKIGRKYVPVSEYDSDFLDSMRGGTHLVMCYPGGKSTRYNIKPNYAALIAASRVAEDAISAAIMKAGEIRLGYNSRRRELTQEQRDAWHHLVKVFGDDARQLEWPSVRECAEAGAQAMVEEAAKLLDNPTVKNAWDHFQLVCDLTVSENA